MTVEQSTDGSWSIEQTGEGSLILKFVGATPTASLNEFLLRLTASMPAADAALVFDLRELEGYNPETKEPIKAWLLRHKLAIRELTVLVPKAGTIVKMATAAIGLAVGVKLTIREEAAESDPPSKVANL